jgi:hypothetical protein
MRASPRVHTKRDTPRVVFDYVVRLDEPLGLMAQAANGDLSRLWNGWG